MHDLSRLPRLFESNLLHSHPSFRSVRFDPNVVVTVRTRPRVLCDLHLRTPLHITEAGTAIARGIAIWMLAWNARPCPQNNQRPVGLGDDTLHPSHSRQCRQFSRQRARWHERWRHRYRRTTHQQERQQPKPPMMPELHLLTSRRYFPALCRMRARRWFNSACRRSRCATAGKLAMCQWRAPREPRQICPLCRTRTPFSVTTMNPRK